jgi:hypothetical protein
MCSVLHWILFCFIPAGLNKNNIIRDYYNYYFIFYWLSEGGKITIS